VYTFVLGEPTTLDNGDRFLNWSAAGQMERVTVEGQSLWQVNSPAGFAFGYHTLASSLYVSDQGNAGSGATEGTGGAQAFSEVGVCGQRGEGTVDGTTFEGFEEFYLIGEEGFGQDICVVRFDVTRVGAAPAGCDDPAAGVQCLWTHLVEYQSPSIVTDTDGVCANSELGLDEAAIAAITGSRAAYGFVSEYAGHNSVLMKHDEASSDWDAYGNATWDEQAAAFRFDRRDGFCGY
jgi:hypothetical protein